MPIVPCEAYESTSNPFIRGIFISTKNLDFQRQEAVRLRKVRLKSYTHKMPAFSITEGIGCDFHKWLQTSCGGGKALGEATQQARRGMKFLMYALGEPSTDATLTNEFIDCCLGTPSVIITFLQSMEEKWELSFSASLNYMRAVNDLMDFRKSAGVTDNVLRSFTVTKVYLRRGIGNIARKKKIQLQPESRLRTTDCSKTAGRRLKKWRRLFRIMHHNSKTLSEASRTPAPLH